MSATFKKIGDFKKAERILKTMPQRIRAVVGPAFEQMGFYYEGEVVKGLDSQAPAGQQFVPLAAATIEARARRRGTASDLALIDTADMRNSVTHKALKGPLGVFIGLLRTTMHPQTGEPVANLGAIHENVTRTIPARPFIGPIARSRSLRRRAKRVFRNAVRRQRARLMR